MRKGVSVPTWMVATSYDDTVIVALGIMLAIGVRWSLRRYVSNDFTVYTSKWYDAIKMQGFAVFRSNFADYTPAYLYLLYGVSLLFPHLAPVVAVKLPAMVCDFVCAWFVSRLVYLKYHDRVAPLLAFFATIFAPTVVMNSSMWGQSDSVYTTALLASIYFLATERSTQALVAYGVAFAFKPQAIFLAPLILVLLLRRQITWQQLLLVPLIYLASIIPAGLAGRPWRELLLIYETHTEALQMLTMGAPNIYTWVQSDQYNMLYVPGLIVAVIVCFLFVVAVYKSKRVITRTTLLHLALVSVLIVPYVTPKMHERYFFPADVLSIAWGFYMPKYFWVPVAIGLTSFFVYMPFLMGLLIINWPFLALGLFIIIVVVIWQAALALYAEPT